MESTGGMHARDDDDTSWRIFVLFLLGVCLYEYRVYFGLWILMSAVLCIMCTRCKLFLLFGIIIRAVDQLKY